MAIILKNKNIKLKIETPGEKYRGSRFDWNGTVTQVWVNGKKMLSQEKKIFHRDDKIYGRGLHNEFGIKMPVGYDDVKPGDYFPKIGTGWLKRDDKPYFFFTQYMLEPLDFSFQKASDEKAIFMCASGERNGYAYRYTKKFELTENGFTVSYDLENCGAKKITTTEYIHNFLLPFGEDVGPQLELSFNWNYSPEKLSENVKTEGLVEFTKSGARFVESPDNSTEYFLGGVFEARDDASFNQNGKWVLANSTKKFEMSEETNFVPYHTDVWGHKKCISPELFKYIEIETGEKAQWQRRYNFLYK